MAHGSSTARKAKGIKIRQINRIVILSSLLLCFFFVQSIVNIRKDYSTLAVATEECIRCRQNAQQAKEGSYYLTEQVHLFVTTGDKQYADGYFNEVNTTRRRDRAIQDLREMTVISSAHEPLIEAMVQSDELMEREIYAIRLVAEANGDDLSEYDPRVVACAISRDDSLLSAEEKRAFANQIVFDDGYLAYRNNIDANIKSFVDATYQLSEQAKIDSRQLLSKEGAKQSVLICLMFALAVTNALCIWRMVLLPLKQNTKAIHEGLAFQVSGAYEFKNLALLYNSIFDIRHEKERMLRHRADHDPLTGLLNKGAFDRLSEQLTDRGISLACLIIDIDNFKKVNDTHGHAVGDDTIKLVANLLKRSFRRQDIVARVGGDEFAVIMLDVTAQSAENIAVKMETLNDILQDRPAAIPLITISSGGAFSETGYSEQLLKQADDALYYVKQNGKHGCAFHHQIAHIERGDT